MLVPAARQSNLKQILWATGSYRALAGRLLGPPFPQDTLFAMSVDVNHRDAADAGRQGFRATTGRSATMLDTLGEHIARDARGTEANGEIAKVGKRRLAV